MLWWKRNNASRLPEALEKIVYFSFFCLFVSVMSFHNERVRRVFLYILGQKKNLLSGWRSWNQRRDRAIMRIRFEKGTFWHGKRGFAEWKHVMVKRKVENVSLMCCCDNSVSTNIKADSYYEMCIQECKANLCWGRAVFLEGECTGDFIFVDSLQAILF